MAGFIRFAHPSGRLWRCLRFTPAEPASPRSQLPYTQPIKKATINVAFSLVGVAGFEPATPCPPDKCATRLRYTPNALIIPYFCKNCKKFYAAVLILIFLGYWLILLVHRIVDFNFISNLFIFFNIFLNQSISFFNCCLRRMSMGHLFAKLYSF